MIFRSRFRNIAAQLSWIRENLLPAGAEDIPVPHNFVITAPPHNPQRPMSGTEKRNASGLSSGPRLFPRPHNQRFSLALPYLNPQTVSFCEMLQMENHINPAGQPPWTPPPPPPIAAAEVSSTSSTAPPEVGGLGELENLLKSGDMDLEHMSAKELLERLVQSKKTAQTTPNPVESTKQAETSDAKEEENGIS